MRCTLLWLFCCERLGNGRMQGFEHQIRNYEMPSLHMLLPCLHDRLSFAPKYVQHISGGSVLSSELAPWNVFISVLLVLPCKNVEVKVLATCTGFKLVSAILWGLLCMRAGTAGFSLKISSEVFTNNTEDATPRHVISLDFFKLKRRLYPQMQLVSHAASSDKHDWCTAASLSNTEALELEWQGHRFVIVLSSTIPHFCILWSLYWEALVSGRV